MTGVLVATIWVGLVNQLRVEWAINPQYSYGWGVPILAAYLLLKRWPDRPEPTTPGLPAAITLMASLAFFALLPVRLFQEANPDWRFVSWTYAIVVLALTFLGIYFTGGRGWLNHFFAPIAFLILAVPWPTGLENWLVQSLTHSVATIAVEILNWMGIIAHQRGNLIQLPSGIVGINEACSGVRSFQSTLMISVFLGELYRFSAPRRVTLFVAGAAIAFSFNVARAFFLTLHCVRHGTQAASALHDPAGYLVFGASFASLLGACLLLKRGQLPPAATAAGPAHTAAPRSFPRSFLIAVGAWLAVVELSTELWYRFHERSTTSVVKWEIQWPKNAQQFRFTPLSEDVQRILRYSAGTSANWHQSDGSEWLLYFFRWEPGRAAAQLAKNHSPEICLPSAGLKLVKDLGVQTLSVQNVELPFRSYQFERLGQPLHVFFCIWEDRRRNEDLSGEENFSVTSRVRAVLAGRRHLGQQVLEVAVTGFASPDEARHHLQQSLQQLIAVSRTGS